MGGAKKKSLRQIEKRQQPRPAKQGKRTPKTGRKSVADTIDLRFSLHDFTEEDLGDLAKIKALTPFSVATKYNVKLSVAKDLLELLEKRQTIEKIASGRNLKIYKFIGKP